MLFTATNTLGCKPYLTAQSKACYCPSAGSSSKNSKNKQKEQTYSSKRDNREERDKPPNYGWKNADEM